MRVVLDTNVYISALTFPSGICDQIVCAARAGLLKVFISPDILTEIKTILTNKFEFTEEEACDAVDRVLAIASLVYPRFRLKEIVACDSDNRILECASEANAHFLVTGDKRHILPLKKFGRTHILTPSQFMGVIEKY